MKTTTLINCFVLSFLALSFAKAQNIQFENAAFKAALLLASPDNGIAEDVNGNWVAIDTDHNGEISLEEALNIYQLQPAFLDTLRESIVSLKGIEYFTNLTSLNCSNLPNLESLDVSKNLNLQELSLSYSTQIKTLDVTKNLNLQSLSLFYCTQIETLDVTKNVNLRSLSLDFNFNGGIKTLDVSKNTNLQTLFLVRDAVIKTLDVSSKVNLLNLVLTDCTGLTSLYMKNGFVGKLFTRYGNAQYNFLGTNLKYICCDEDEIDRVKDYMRGLGTDDLLVEGWGFSNLTVTSDCETSGLGTEDLSPQAKAELYPNPVKDVLYFSASGKVTQAEIYDLNGRLVKTAAVSSNSVNVSDLTNGLYFIVLETDKGVVKEKFIKN